MIFKMGNTSFLNEIKCNFPLFKNILKSHALPTNIKDYFKPEFKLFNLLFQKPIRVVVSLILPGGNVGKSCFCVFISFSRIFFETFVKRVR